MTKDKDNKDDWRRSLLSRCIRPISATRSLLKKTNNLILKNHIDNCVREGILAGDESKVDEIIKALEKQVWQQEEKQQDPSMLVVFK